LIPLHPLANDAEARATLERAWARIWGRPPDHAELDYAQAIAWLETGYGRIGQFANMASQGIYNWGGLQKGSPDASGACPPHMFPGVDSGAPRCFFGYQTDDEAAEAFLRTLTKTAHWPVLDAMQGSPEAVAHALNQPPAYYEGSRPLDRAFAETEYAKAIRGKLAEIHSGGGHLPAEGPGAGMKKASNWALAFGLGGAGLLGLWFLRQGAKRA